MMPQNMITTMNNLTIFPRVFTVAYMEMSTRTKSLKD